jgi:FkbM family methyltransferase
MNIQARNETYISRFIRGTPDAMYDIGVGPKSEWRTLGAKFPAMRIYGCEPEPKQHAKLLNAKFPGPLAQVAIGETAGVATLHVPTHNAMCGSLFPVPYANATCEVEVWTLDYFDEQNCLPARILLWLDIEGSELAALRSGRHLLASGRVRWINLEERRAGHRPAEGWCDPGELHAFLIENGYQRVAEYNRHATHQDVIYVHKDEKPCSA